MPEPDPSKSTRKHRPRRGNEHPIVLSQAEQERFWLFVEEMPSGCWEWQGHLHDDGYGIHRVRGLSLRVHRVSWMLTRGDIPNGITLDHLCRNRNCLNPSHLEQVTNRDNILRGESPTAVNARKTHCKRGHPLTPENIFEYGRVRRRRACRLCRKEVRAEMKAWRSGPHKKRPQPVQQSLLSSRVEAPEAS